MKRAALAFVLFATACFSLGRSETTYTGSGETPRTDGALKTAAQDLS